MISVEREIALKTCIGVLFISQAEKGHRSGVRRETICVANAIRRQRLGCLETAVNRKKKTDVTVLYYIILVRCGTTVIS